MPQSLFSWWLARLAELLPSGLRGDLALPPDALLLGVDSSGRVTCSRRERGILFPLTDHVRLPRDVPQVLVLPEGVLLERRVELPLAVARDAERVVALDFDRLTPFAADATIWSLDRIGEDRARGAVSFSLGLVPKARIEPLLAALRGQGLNPTQLECSSAGGIRCLAVGPTGALHWRRVLIAGGLAALAIAAVAVPFIRQQIALDQLSARIAAAGGQAAQSGQLLRRLSPGQADGDRLIAARAQTPLALQTLAAITTALPDDTNLVSLSLQDGRLSIEGTSASAARLIGLLAAQDPIRDPSFSSPVTRTTDGKDAFTLSATVAGTMITAPANPAAEDAP